MQDTVAANRKTNTDAQGRVSLRPAIMATDAGSGPDTIPLPDGTHRLTITGAGGGAAAKGDSDIFDTFAR